MAKLNDNFYNRIIEGYLSLSEKEAKDVAQKAKIVVTNIKSLTDAELSALKCGDIVAKKTGNQYHAYIVSYKEDATGICLTYVDGSGYMETVSYDYTQEHWVYNSTDVTQVQSDAQIKALAKEEVEGTQEGTIDKTLGLNSSGKLVKGTVNAGMSNPMTTAGDIIVAGASGTPTRLGKGNNGDLLRVNPSGNLAYGKNIPVITTAPSAPNTDGLIICVLSSEPAVKYDGYLYIIAPTVPLISFTIENINTTPSTVVTCTAEQGMTWSQWINSGYNTIGVHYDGSAIVTAEGYWITDGNRPVTSADTITSNFNYILD